MGRLIMYLKPYSNHSEMVVGELTVYARKRERRRVKRKEKKGDRILWVPMFNYCTSLFDYLVV